MTSKINQKLKDQFYLKINLALKIKLNFKNNATPRINLKKDEMIFKTKFKFH